MRFSPRLLLAATMTALVPLTFAAPDVSALSCIKPNFADTFDGKNAEDQVYWAVYGRLSRTGPRPEVVQPTDPNIPTPVSETLVFDGSFLTGTGLTQPQRYTVVSKPQCLGPWCGGTPATDTPLLTFLTRNDAGVMELRTGACPGDVHQEPSNDQLWAIIKCLENNGCGPEQRAQFE